MQILTPSGFQSFDGILRSKSPDILIEIGLSTKAIKVTPEHRFVVSSGVERLAKDLVIGDSLNGNEIISIKRIDNKEDVFVFDPINVRGGNVYLHDGNIASHNCAIGSADTLIAPEFLLSLKAEPIIETVRGVNIYRKPIEGHRYVMTVDVSKGRGQDYSTVTVVDTSVRPFEQVATFRDNLMSPLIFPDLIVGLAKRFNEALVIIENNDVGQVVCNGVYYDMEYENTFVESATKNGIGVTMTKRVKKIGCSFLKDLIEAKKLMLYDADSILELSAFEANGDSYAATGDNHDDLVMNLVLLAWFLTTPFAELKDGELKELLFAEKAQAMENELVPAGFLGNNQVAPTRSMEIYNEMVDEYQKWVSL